VVLKELSGQRRKLLELHYKGQISGEGFAEEERRLQAAIGAARDEVAEGTIEDVHNNELVVRFEQVSELLASINIEEVWRSAEKQERRVLIEELIEWVSVFPDHLEVTVNGAPPLHVLYQEVGLKQSDFVGVGGPTRLFPYQGALAA